MSRFLDTRRILVPVDFSDSGRPVLDYACDLARDRTAAVRLVHVVGIPVAPFDPAYGVAADPRILLDLQAAAGKQLEALAAGVKGLSVDVKVLVGSPSREIVREAREWSADLVVVGTHGRTGLRHVFLGSVAENVVRLAPCPVLTVRLGAFSLEHL